MVLNGMAKVMMKETSRFRLLGISDRILDALDKKGFEEPSPIQELTIPLLMTGSKDVIGQAQTGTGKTAAFGIPIIEFGKRSKDGPGALILAPTRELSMQIADELNSLKGENPLRIAAFYGGQNIAIQLKLLSAGIDVVIGTPGRIIDLMERKKLHFDNIKFAVLDEADEMLDMGFIEDIERILSATPEDKRMLMFSATMPKEVLSIAERFMRDYEIVRTKTIEQSNELTEQIYYEVRRENKFEALSRIIDMEEELYGIVFCHTRSDVDELAEQLQRHHYSAEAIHGDIPQSQRTKVIANFKDRKFKLLIATDVAARGIDVNDLTHVINYSIPQSHETYIHRIGRTGRAGKSGTAITFVTPGEQRKLSMIRKKVPGEITRRNLPQAWEIVEAKKSRFTALLNTIIGEGKHKQYLSFADSLLTSEHTPPELLAAFLQERFKNELVMDKYINLPANDTFVHPEMHDHSQVYIALGYDAGYNKRKLLDLIFKRSGVGCERLGKVECSGTHTLVNASAGDAERIVKAFQGEKDPETRITGLAVQDDSISEKSSGPLERRSSKRRFSSFRKDSFHGQRDPHKGKKPRYAK